MASASIEFNGQKMIADMTLTVRSQLPWIATKTLQGLADQVQVDLRDLQERTFDNISRETKKFIVDPSTKSKLETTIKHKDEAAKGNAPADYLRPQVVGGPAYPTRMQRRMWAKGFMPRTDYLVPTDSSGRVSWPGKPSVYTKALWGIAGMEELRGTVARHGRKNIGKDVYAANMAKKYQSHGAYVYVPRNLADAEKTDPLVRQRANTIRHLNRGAGKPFMQSLPSAGIYKVKGKSLEQVFDQIDYPSISNPGYSFHDTATQSVRENAQRIFDQMVKIYAGSGKV